MAKIKFRNQPISVKIFYISFVIFFALEAALHILPSVWSILSSLKTAEDFFKDMFALPSEWRFENYLRVFTEFKYRQYNYLDMLFNSLWELGLKLFVSMLSSVCFAYAVARFRFPGRDFLYALVIFAKTIPIIGSGPAEFKLISSLGMVNNPALIWLAWAGGFDFAFIVLYGTFKGISQTYSEAAKMDGANNLFILFKIILPQATPAIIALAIEEAIGIWNNYGTVMIYLREYPNLAYGLYLFSSESNYIADSKPIYFAAIVISSIPPIVLYMANLNKILTNITTGGLKG